MPNTNVSTFANASTDAGQVARIKHLRDQLEALRPELEQARFITVVVVAHNDDEAIGPGATVATLASSGGMVLLVVVGADNPVRREETCRCAEVLGVKQNHVFQLDFPDGQLALHADSIRHCLHLLDDIVRPDLMLTHKADDHPDHTTVNALVRQVFGRGGTNLLHFRIPQPIHSPWNPTVKVRVTNEAARIKLGPLFSAFPTQNWKDYFDPAQTAGILAEAGHQAGSTYAEPFETTHLNMGDCPCACGALVLGRNAIRQAEANTQPAGAEVDTILQLSRVVLEPSRCGQGSLTLARRARKT